MKKEINFNSILPVEARIFYEDNMPYLWYKGETFHNGKEYYITFPKIGLAIETASIISEISFYGNSNTLECNFVPCFYNGNEVLVQTEEKVNETKECKRSFDF